MSEHIHVRVAGAEHCEYAETIVAAMESAAKQRGTGIARRDPEYIRTKMRQGKAVIALDMTPVTMAPPAEAPAQASAAAAATAASARPRFAGFCYIETWSEKTYVANSGLIVVPEQRHSGLATQIKRAAFELSQRLFPDAKIFGITTSHAVMKINTQLGYVPVPFSELTDDEEFWAGCRSCPNHDILMRTAHRMCLCTGMLFDPADPKAIERHRLHLQDDALILPAADEHGAARAHAAELHHA